MDDLNIAFSGSLVGTDSYTTQGDEVMRGVVHRIDGAEEEVPGSGVKLHGGEEGIAFDAQNIALAGEAGSDMTADILAEARFTADSFDDMATIFSAGGNLFVRAEAGQLSYGFDSHTNSSWQKHRRTAPLPVAGVEHAVSLRYSYTEAETEMTVTIDGETLPAVTSPAPAAISTGAGSAFGFGNEVNPGGADRGMSGLLAAVRVASGENAALPFEFQPAPAAEELLDLDFSGTTDAGDYQPSAAEVVAGQLELRSGTEITDAGLTLTGAEAGADFTAAAPLFGSESLDAPFIAEVDFTPKADQRSLATILALGGNLFARYGADGFEYGFSVHSADGWHDYKQSVAAPSPGTVHSFSIAYLPSSDGTVLRAWLDGVELPQVEAPEGATRSAAVSQTLALGNEFAAQAGTRAFTGDISRARLAKLTDDFTPDLLKFQEISSQDCDPIDDLAPANYIDISVTECDANIVEKTALVRPTEGQLEWQEMGLTAFVHFGINTFYDQEWGDGTEDPARFDPSDIDVDSWVKTLRDTGHKLAILVVKHHDGFALYNSRYTSHDVGSSPWEDGHGDVLAQFTAAAHKYGMKVGVYLSPADSNQEIEGVFGNGSAKSPRTIPTLVDGDDRAGADLPTFEYEASDYGQYFLNMLYEVLTEYGPIDEVWFDGAQGNTEKHETYDYPAYYDLIHQLQPNALIAVGGRDIRWVGTEAGQAREDEWAPIAVTNPDDGGKLGRPATSGSLDADAGSRSQTVAAARAGANALHWWPTEADMKLTQGWFAHPSDAPKSGAQLLDHYLNTVGRNSVMLLNTPPTTTGQFAEASKKALADFASLRRRSFTLDHALGVPVSTDDGETSLITDGNSRSGWGPDATSGTFTLDLAEDSRVDSVSLSEEVATSGQTVEKFHVEALIDGQWQKVAEAGTIGVKRIVRLDEPVTAQSFRIVVDKARAGFSLANISLFETLDEDPGQLTEVYFDPTAAVAGDGSKQHPFNSLAQFRDAELAPGATVTLYPGHASDMDVPFWGYGTADEPITVTTADGQAPTFGDRTARQVFSPLTEQGWQLDLPEEGGGGDVNANANANDNAEGTSGTEADDSASGESASSDSDTQAGASGDASDASDSGSDDSAGGGTDTGAGDSTGEGTDATADGESASGGTNTGSDGNPGTVAANGGADQAKASATAEATSDQADASAQGSAANTAASGSAAQDAGTAEQPEAESSPGLAVTGADAARVAVLAGLALLAGAVLYRRRRTSRP